MILFSHSLNPGREMTIRSAREEYVPSRSSGGRAYPVIQQELEVASHSSAFRSVVGRVADESISAAGGHALAFPCDSGDYYSFLADTVTAYQARMAMRNSTGHSVEMPVGPRGTLGAATVSVATPIRTASDKYAGTVAPVQQPLLRGNAPETAEVSA